MFIRKLEPGECQKHPKPKCRTARLIEPTTGRLHWAILNCPDCNQPFATKKNHKIISIEPLTVETPVTCPYSKDFTFKVSEEKIMPLPA
jgi:hypothetical protein